MTPTDARRRSDAAAARVGELESARFGSAELADVDTRLERAGSGPDKDAAAILRSLAATRLRLGDRLNEADALVAVAASLRGRRASLDG